MLASQLLEISCTACSDSQKEYRGCEKKPPMPMVMDGQELERCPLRPFFENPVFFNSLFERYRWMKDGYLPDPGQMPDQANRFVAYSTVITKALDDVMEDKRKKQEKEQAAAAKKAKIQGGGKRPPKAVSKKPWRGRRR